MMTFSDGPWDNLFGHLLHMPGHIHIRCPLHTIPCMQSLKSHVKNPDEDKPARVCPCIPLLRVTWLGQ